MIATAQPSILPRGSIGNLAIRPRIQALRAAPGQIASRTADALDSLLEDQLVLQKALSSPLPALTKLEVADEKGNLITWIGSKVIGNQTYQGLWSKRLYVGGQDAATAPLFADENGNVVIGKNGSLSIQNPLGTQKGYLGVKTEAALTISAAVDDGTGLVKVTTLVPHLYVTGDAVIANIPGVGVTPFPPFDAAITIVDANNFTLNSSVFAGAYTSGGTVYRYYGGIWAQTAAFGGTGFADANIRAFADGHIAITNAFIDIKNYVTGVGGTEVVISPIAGGAAVAGLVIYTLGPTGLRTIPKTSIVAGTLAVTSSTGITTVNGSFVNTPVLQINSIQVLSSTRALGNLTSISSSGAITFTSLSGVAVLATSSGGQLQAADPTAARTLLSVYSQLQINNLLAFKADKGTYSSSSAGSPPHIHNFTI